MEQEQRWVIHEADKRRFIMMARELDNNRKYEMQGVSQAFVILDLLTNSKVVHTLSCLSDCLGMSKNKTFRMLVTLEQRGVVERFGSGWYRFGGKAFALARRILVSESVLCQARPIMAELAGLFNEAVYLATYKNGAALLENMVDCTQVIKSASFIGAEISFLHEPEKLSATFFRTKQKSFPGLVVEEGNLDAEITTVSAEFSNSVYSPAGALVVIAPTFRMTAERIQSDVAPVLLAGVQRLSVLLGKVPEQNRVVLRPFISAGNNIFPEKLEFVLPINHQQRGSCHQPGK
jgi:DNA-binding IclR family transcriptional regulator